MGHGTMDQRPSDMHCASCYLQSGSIPASLVQQSRDGTRSLVIGAVPLAGREKENAADKTYKAHMLHARTLLFLFCRLSSHGFARLLIHKYSMNVGQDSA